MSRAALQRSINDLRDRLKVALDEARILVLGIQVLVGFDYDAVFQKGFEQLPDAAQYVKGASLVLLLIALGFTMAPAAYHQLAKRGEVSAECLRYVTIAAGIALLPFALGLGGEIYVAVQKVVGVEAGLAAGIASSCLALLLWYGLELAHRAKGNAMSRLDGNEGETAGTEPGHPATPLKDKIQFVLTETRVVLPGVQALLGFQVIIVLSEPFDKLDVNLKYLHMVCLFLSAISMTLLMAPAAYHRLAEMGENTQRLHRFASVMVLSSMALLALGLVGDLYIVVQRVTRSDLAALICSLIMLVFFYALWFGYSLLRRDPARGESD